jgi:hypothetical protein
MNSLEVLKDSETEELYIEFSEDLLKQVEWDVGDDLVWSSDREGLVWTINKKS